MYSLFLTALLTTLATASPNPLVRGEGTTFSPITSISNAPDAVKELNGRIWAISSNADGHAVLVDRNQQSLFHQYTSSSGLPAVATADTGIIITPGGSATVPSINTVDLVAGGGTAGVNISLNMQGILTLQFEGGGFMACRASFLNQNAQNPDDFVLSYRKEGQRRFADCADVLLISGCAGGPRGELGVPEVVGCEPH
ncbi:hypothetical protein K469DRAFT_695794 [Zopfia rhizophila CBS 207.26]|uniref:Cell wall protein PhiA n=1 Tax=Zopfia rhizophila CBS 207.26 TaxID=1314779 RepID=A0A6A6EHT8_9PEZI|nr:hypothetical protein K469DRAFT_695794 [Zopfia rhizophila CBS 207.26]